MGSTARNGKPNEYAAKINHTHLINDPLVKEFIKNCTFPASLEEIDKTDLTNIFEINESNNPIEYIVAIDGGYTIAQVKKGFPSAEFAFFQFGALRIKRSDLENLSNIRHILPEDMETLKNLSRIKLIIPSKNIINKNTNTLRDSVRQALYDFFMTVRDNTTFMESLKWLVFEKYKNKSSHAYELSNHPLDLDCKAIILNEKDMLNDYTFNHPKGKIFLIDVFRFHEVIDEDHGASGLLGYLTRLIEQLLMVHYIKYIYENQPSMLKNFLFIIDGPLSFAGQTANMHKLLRDLINYLSQSHTLNIVGIEKSGPFVDHAQLICHSDEKRSLLKKNHCLLLSNDYIYKYIIPGDSLTMHYGSTSYYGGKVIFHSNDGQVIVATVPTKDKNAILSASKITYLSLDVCLMNIKNLKCSMYADSLIPIALANKLVSLANHPSKNLLEKFALQQILDNK